MARVLAIDYGLKRTGLAVTDDMQIIASALDTVETDNIFEYLKSYSSKENIETFVIGEPKNLDGTDTHNSQPVRNFKVKIEKQFPSIKIVMVDERFTSKIAFQSMIESGVKKNDRRKKENIDKLSATIILQDYLEQRNII